MTTQRLYVQDSPPLVVTATVTAVQADMFCTDVSPFFAGGGGQPADQGTVNGVPITQLVRDDADCLWHTADCSVAVGDTVTLQVDALFRQTVSRYHTALHILNTLALTHYQAWLTGAAIAFDYARIDIKVDLLEPAMIADLEARMNTVIAANHAVRAWTIPAETFAQRPELVRTINVAPPAYRGQIRVVEIVGFDAQACGGTHVTHTAMIGRCEIFKSENKGKHNKRLYVRFTALDK
ncbi:MAG: alanyl-tRNA editing protein [Roseiflexaceae bacterium]